MKLLCISILTICLLGSGCAVSPHTDTPQATTSTTNSISATKKITAADTVITVEVADTPESQAQGLSDRTNLTENTGMLFDFRYSTNKKPSFWMKQMKFDLDLVWIKDNYIVQIDKNVPAPDPATPLNQLPQYSPEMDIDYVLELPAGWGEAHRLKAGDSITL